MSWLKTRPEGEDQGESGGHQSPPTAGAARRGAVPHHLRNSPTVEPWLHAGRVIFLWKLGSTAAAAEVLRREHGRRQGMWWEANATHPWRSRGAVPHHRRKSLMVEAWLHAGRVIFLQKNWEVQQQPKSYDGTIIVGVWRKGNAAHPWRTSDVVPLSSERSDGDSWSMEQGG